MFHQYSRTCPLHNTGFLSVCSRYLFNLGFTHLSLLSLLSLIVLISVRHLHCSKSILGVRGENLILETAEKSTLLSYKNRGVVVSICRIH